MHQGFQCTYGCRICPVKGEHRENTSNGMYFLNDVPETRPISDYVDIENLGVRIQLENKDNINVLTAYHITIEWCFCSDSFCSPTQYNQSKLLGTR
jgi:hypothetical protein